MIDETMRLEETVEVTLPRPVVEALRVMVDSPAIPEYSSLQGILYNYTVHGFHDDADKRHPELRPVWSAWFETIDN